MFRQAVAALAALAGCAIGGPALAFDTAPHATITEQAMMMAGYNRTAADVAQVENWLTDYYTSAPSTRFKGDRCALEKLHFDDVFTDADVDAYWKTLLRNTLAAAAKAKADNDPRELYVVLGVSLHVVQDFYAHSNWVESSGYKGQGFDTTTYFQWKRTPWQRTDVVHTGWYANCLNIAQGSHTPHGGYTGGMNHDSVVRQNYNKAYVYALAASVEWIQQIQQALQTAPGDPGFATRALFFSPADGQELTYDQQASLLVSEWVALSGADGHWNGNHSGYGVAFAAFMIDWAASPDSAYVKAFNELGVYQALSRGLYAPYVGPDPDVVPTSPLVGTVIDMRTASVSANRNLLGKSSYFGKVTPILAAGQGHAAATLYPSRDAAQHWRPNTDVPWEYLTFAPPWSPRVTLHYTVADEYGWPGFKESPVQINGASTAVDFVCDAQAGGGCVWGNPGGSQQQMPGQLAIKGADSYGVALKGIAIQLSPAGPRP